MRRGRFLHLPPSKYIIGVYRPARLVIFHRPRNYRAASTGNVAANNNYTKRFTIRCLGGPESGGGGGAGCIDIYGETIILYILPHARRGKPCLRSRIPVDMNWWFGPFINYLTYHHQQTKSIYNIDRRAGGESIWFAGVWESRARNGEKKCLIGLPLNCHRCRSIY